MNDERKLPSLDGIRSARVSDESPQRPTSKREFLRLIAHAVTFGLNRAPTMGVLQPALDGLAATSSKELGLTQFYMEAEKALSETLEPLAGEPGPEFRPAVALRRPVDDVVGSIRERVSLMSDHIIYTATTDRDRPNTEAIMLAANSQTLIELDLLTLKVMFAIEQLAAEPNSTTVRVMFLRALGDLLERVKHSALLD
jgi:hypothetical protein